MNEEALKLTLSSSPHAHSPNSTRRIMLDVCIALLPALIGAIVFFGARALTLTALSVAGCVFFEWAYRRIMKKDNTTGDLSARGHGHPRRLCLPGHAPFWTILIGDFFAIVVVKQLFGGIGANIVNPALAARAFLFSWPLFMNTWVRSGVHVPAFSNPTTASLDGLTAATPMASLHVGAMPEASVLDLFLGRTGGSLGEVSAMLLLLGGIYLLVRRVISARIPLAYLGTVAVLAFLFPRGGAARLDWMLVQLLSGGLMLGAWFMATDYTTSPVTHGGQIVYGVGCGVLTFLFRYFGSYVEGVSYAILIMNCCVGFFDRIGVRSASAQSGRKSRRRAVPKHDKTEKHGRLCPAADADALPHHRHRRGPAGLCQLPDGRHHRRAHGRGRPLRHDAGPRRGRLYGASRVGRAGRHRRDGRVERRGRRDRRPPDDERLRRGH